MRVFKVSLTLVVALLISIGIFGCGGSGNGDSNPFRGAYREAFTRGGAPDTALLITVDDDGDTNVVISDANGVLVAGSGTTTEGGSFNATAFEPQSAGHVSPAVTSVTVAATFYGDDTAFVNLTGAIADNLTVDKFENANTCPVQGTIFGEYGGDDTGTFQIAISSNGHVTGVAHTSGGDVNVTGTVNLDGSVNFQASGFAGGATWAGFFFLTPSFGVGGVGTWSDNNGDNGTWEGSNSI